VTGVPNLIPVPEAPRAFLVPKGTTLLSKGKPVTSSDDNPVIVVLNKMSLALQGEVPAGPYSIPLGKANIVRPGSNYTIVALGRMVHEALKAAEQLKAFGLDAEVIDPRTLQPFDTATVVESVKTANDIYSPVSGEITEANKLVVADPALVNSDPYAEGWFYKIKLANPAELNALLTPKQYQAQIGGE